MVKTIYTILLKSSFTLSKTKTNIQTSYRTILLLSKMHKKLILQDVA